MATVLLNATVFWGTKVNKESNHRDHNKLAHLIEDDKVRHVREKEQ
jgi:hypothetical protein